MINELSADFSRGMLFAWIDYRPKQQPLESGEWWSFHTINAVISDIDAFNATYCAWDGIT